MDIRTGILGRASAIRINYQKWVGPSLTLRTLSSRIGVPPLLDSEAIAFQRYVRM